MPLPFSTKRSAASRSAAPPRPRARPRSRRAGSCGASSTAATSAAGRRPASGASWAQSADARGDPRALREALGHEREVVAGAADERDHAAPLAVAADPVDPRVGAEHVLGERPPARDQRAERIAQRAAALVGRRESRRCAAQPRAIFCASLQSMRATSPSARAARDCGCSSPIGRRAAIARYTCEIVGEQAVAARRAAEVARRHASRRARRRARPRGAGARRGSRARRAGPSRGDRRASRSAYASRRSPFSGVPNSSIQRSSGRTAPPRTSHSGGTHTTTTPPSLASAAPAIAASSAAWPSATRSRAAGYEHLRAERPAPGLGPERRRPTGSSRRDHHRARAEPRELDGEVPRERRAHDVAARRPAR